MLPRYNIYIVRQLDAWCSDWHYLFSTKRLDIAEAWAKMEGFATVEESKQGFNLL